jgi:Fur family peroxide stress response transcriptional regulator
MIRPESYRSLGLKLTPQRLAILELLNGNTSHPSAENIYRSVRQSFPTISLATVYTTLAALRDKGNILELTLDADKKRYDPDTSEHDHAICSHCRSITDIPAGSSERAHGNVPHGFMVKKIATHYYGICPACRTK